MMNDEGETNTTAETTPELDAGATRDELMSAYRAAVGGNADEPKKDDAAPAAEKKADAPKADADGEAKADEPEPDAKGIAKILKQREKANAEREEAKKAIAEAKAAAEEAKTARQAALDVQKEARAFLDTLRTNPIKAIRAAGWDPDELVLNLRDEGTPGSKAQRDALTLRQELDELKQLLRERDGVERKAREEREAQVSRAQMDEARKGFLGVALNAEKFPALSRTYTKRPHLLVSEAERVADDYHRRTGQYASWEEIAEYLDSDHTDAKPAEQQTAGRGASQAERAPGSRTLTAADGSDRRSAPVLEWDAMTPEQQRQAQIADMKAALRSR